MESRIKPPVFTQAEFPKTSSGSGSLESRNVVGVGLNS